MRVNDVHVQKSCNFHACLRHTMRFARWAGFFPVQCFNQNVATETKFNVKYLYSVYNIGTIIGQVVMLAFSLYHFVDTKVTLESFSVAIFYVTRVIAAILLLRLAKHWPELMKVVEETELSLTRLKLDKSTIRKSNTIAYVMVVIALVVHILSINFSIKLIRECLNGTTFNEDIIAEYSRIRMPFIFNYMSYNAFNVVWAMIFTVQGTFLWNLTDVIMICVSIYIASYFYKLNQVIDYKKINSTISWGQLREYYSKLAMLVKQIDDQLSCFMLLSFFTNLYFICLQLFYLWHRYNVSLGDCVAEKLNNVLSSPLGILHFCLSFSFSATRAICLSLFAANVHVAGKHPIIPVYSIEPIEYDQEVRRFQFILRFTTVALSGKYFYITRNTILKAMGIIITYELVLLQFGQAYSQENSVNDTAATTEAALI